MECDFAVDPITEYPNNIIIYHKKLNGISVVSVQIDTKMKTVMEFKLT